MIYLSNDPYPQEISIPRSFGVIVPQRKVYLTEDDIAANLETDSDRKVLAASQGVALKRMVDEKADADDVYTKQETDELLSQKADKSDTYTKEQVDTALAGKADSSDIPTKTSDLDNDSGFVTGQEVSQTYETKQDATAKESALQTAINGKQDTINDLQTIREGAAAGATAYQKPQTGIPASDLAPGVIPIIPVEDVKVGGASVVTNKIAEIPAIPDAVEANPTIPAGVTPTDLQNLKVGDDFFSVPQGGGGVPEIFWAEYGVTTAAEIAQAIADGKAVMVAYNGKDYLLGNTETSYYYFGITISTTNRWVRVHRTTNVWFAGSASLESISDKSQSVPTDRTSTTKYPSVKAVADSLGKWGVISQTQTWTGSNATGWDYTMSNLVYGLIPQANIDLYVSVGAVFNESTGYFELNGLTDISYNEMQKIYAYTIPFSIGLVAVSGGMFYDVNVRTNLRVKKQKFNQYSTAATFGYLFFGSPAEKVCFVNELHDNTASSYAAMFKNCYHLKEVDGRLSLRYTSSASATSEMFANCYSLESASIKNIKFNLSFANSPRLSVASLAYMVNTAENTTAITITLHPTAYARCQADTTEYTYNSQTYTGIIAYAAAKNITIASA